MVVFDGQCVLVVDDDVMLWISFVVVFKMMGVQVLIVCLGYDVFVVVEWQQLSVVLLDFVMLDGDGYWLFDQIWYLLNGGGYLLVVVVIVYVGIVDWCCVMVVGFDVYLCKLVDMLMFVSVIVDVVLDDVGDGKLCD